MINRIVCFIPEFINAFCASFQLFSASFRYVSFSFSAFVARIVCASALFSCFFQSLTRFPALRYVSSPLLTIFLSLLLVLVVLATLLLLSLTSFPALPTRFLSAVNLLLYSANLFPTFHTVLPNFLALFNGFFFLYMFVQCPR